MVWKKEFFRIAFSCHYVFRTLCHQGQKDQTEWGDHLVSKTSEEDADAFKEAEYHDDEVDGYECVVSKTINSGKGQIYVEIFLLANHLLYTFKDST